MNKKVFNVSVSMQDNYNKVVRGIILNDTGNLLNMILLDDGQPFDYSGFSMATVQIVRPDGTLYVDEAEKDFNLIDPPAGLLSYSLPLAAVNMAGMYYVVITIFGDGHAVSTFNLNYYIEDNAVTDDDDVQNQNEYPLLDKMLTKISGIEENEELRAQSENNRNKKYAEREAEIEEQIGDFNRIKEALEPVADLETKLEQYYEYIKTNIQGIDVESEAAIWTYGKRLKNVTIEPSAWVQDADNADFPYRCDIPVKGISQVNWKVTDVFTDDTDRYNLDPVCNAADDKVQFWIKEVPGHTFTFDSIGVTFMKQVKE